MRKEFDELFNQALTQVGYERTEKGIVKKVKVTRDDGGVLAPGDEYDVNCPSCDYNHRTVTEQRGSMLTVKCDNCGHHEDVERPKT